MPFDPLPLLRRPGTCSHIRFLAFDAPAMPASRGVRQHDCYWYLISPKYIVVGDSAHALFSPGAGVIGDISTRAERGGFFGLFILGPMVRP